MARNYTVRTRILRPVSEVFDAIVSRDKLCQYFTDTASSDMEEGTKIDWRWRHYEATLPVVVDKIVPNRMIRLTLDSGAWKKTITEGYEVAVIFEFEELDEGSTMLSISEEGWKTDADGLKGSHDNCGGWSHMATCLKAWIEHGIDLR